MKKILLLSIILSFLFVSHTFAATFTPTVDGTTIKATLSGVTNTDAYKLVIQDSPFSGDTYTGPGTTNATFDQTVKQSAAASTKKPVTLTWSIGGNKENTTYYVRVVDFPSTYGYLPAYVTPAQTIKTPSVTIPFSPLTTTLDGNNIIVSGKIDTNKVSGFRAADFSASLVYTATIPSPTATALTNTFGPLTSRKTPDNTVCDDSKGSCINDDGTYYWYLTGLQPSTVYYFQQTVTVDNQNSKVDVINHFNSSSGTSVASGSAADQAEQASRGYTLLSKGFPGLTFLPDPDLCAQQRAAAVAGGPAAPKFCDINDVLNYALKLLIGLSGVALVFRLMYEGYRYMTTDVPFISANAKSGFFTALMGLLLALTSYILLNTINPKLVNGTVSVQQLAIGVAGLDGLGTTGITGVASSASDTAWLKSSGRKFTLSLKSGGTITVNPCDPSQIAKITAFGQSFEVEKNLVASILRIDAKWKQMSPQYPINTVGGYNCRTIANSNHISYHSYGLAVDINEDANGVNTAGNMPPAFIQLWTSEGWGWGGSWKSYKDPMHFSKGNSGSSSNGEKGDMQGE